MRTDFKCIPVYSSDLGYIYNDIWTELDVGNKIWLYLFSSDFGYIYELGWMLGTAFERTYTAVNWGTYMNWVGCWKQPLNVFIQQWFWDTYMNWVGCWEETAQLWIKNMVDGHWVRHEWSLTWSSTSSNPWRVKFWSPDWANFYFLKCRRGAAAMLEMQEKKFLYSKACGPNYGSNNGTNTKEEICFKNRRRNRKTAETKGLK